MYHLPFDRREAGGDAAQQCGTSLVFRVRHFHRRVCFPEAERRRRIPAGVVVTVETISTAHQLLYHRLKSSM